MSEKRRGWIGQFLFRWFVSSLGLLIAAGLLGKSVEVDSSASVLIGAGLILTLVNSLVKPVVIFFSLPALLLTLGLFMIVINGLMVLLASHIYSSLEVTNFGAAMLAGMVIGLVNYLLVTIVER